ncbi:MAG TPA: serine/threonine-protein kinase [Kofleriaceae bacterium]|nr:serine/threonine-protein kinase [Kofleriaceae bacterium]
MRSLGSLLGAGGMGRVFAAEHAARRVAVKVLHEEFGEDAAMRARLAAEGEAMWRVRHRNVVRILGQGTHDGRPYLTLEHVDGITLGTLVQREGRLSLARVRSIGEQILLGLSAIHRAGLVHGDMKSDNILIGANDRVTIIDFGLARDVAAPRTADELQTLSGTPEYMAPEVIRGEAPGVASDLYAVGVILYEMVTGMPPFTGKTTPEIFDRHLRDDVVPPSLRAPDRTIPAAFEAIIVRALSKTPELRHYNAELFATAVSRTLAFTRHGEETPPTAHAGTGRVSATTRRSFVSRAPGKRDLAVPRRAFA